MTSVIHDASCQCLSAIVATPTAHRDQRAVVCSRTQRCQRSKHAPSRAMVGLKRPALTALSMILSKNDDAFRRVVRRWNQGSSNATLCVPRRGESVHKLFLAQAHSSGYDHRWRAVERRFKLWVTCRTEEGCGVGLWSQHRTSTCLGTFPSRGQVFKMREKKELKRVDVNTLQTIEISHRCVEKKNTRLSSLQVCWRFADATQCPCRNSTGCLYKLTCISSETLYSTLAPRTSVHVHTAKTRAKDDESRSVTFQYVITRHVPRFLSLHPSRIGAASLTRLMSVSLVRENQEHRPHQVTVFVCQRPKLSSLDHRCWQWDRSSLRQRSKLPWRPTLLPRLPGPPSLLHATVLLPCARTSTAPGHLEQRWSSRPPC